MGVRGEDRNDVGKMRGGRKEVVAEGERENAGGERWRLRGLKMSEEGGSS